MKKILAWLLAFIMVVTPIQAHAIDWPWKIFSSQETTEAVEETAEAAAEPATLAATGDAEAIETENTEKAEQEGGLRPLTYDYDELVVGTAMPMYGTFFTPMWGNGSSDIDVRQLIHGYNLVEWESSISGFQLDPSVVSGSIVRENAAGDHTYTIILYDDLTYSDETRITAWDYAFAFLLRIDPEIAKLGGTPEVLDYLVGYDNYVNGRVRYLQEIERDRQNNVTNANRQIPALAGIRVINNNQLTITISHDVLPHFFELAMLDCNPYPMSVIAPDCEIHDDGNGVYIEGDFDAALLQETLMGEDGYIAKPTVTSGPYRLVSFDGNEAKFELNEFYKGDSHGAKPTIERLTFRQANKETMIDELMNCEYGLLNHVTVADLIQEGMTEIGKDPRYAAANYPRSGLSFISFNTENPAVASKEVRQAIAHCIDQTAITTETVSNYGLRVNGYYGLGQWMYQLLNGTLGYPVEEPAAGATAAEQRAYDQEIAQWEALTAEMEEKLPVYEGTNPDEAIRLLVQDGWILNRDGENFDPEKDDVRCKRIDGEIVPLELKLVYAKSASVREALEGMIEPLKDIGIVLTVEGIDGLLDQYYGHVERDYDMIFLATDFNVLFDPSPSFEPDGDSNYFGVEDAELYDLAQDMIRTEPGELLEYCEKWLAFQERFNEVEPVIPVYSNIYFDFYPRVLQGYNIADYATWSQAVVPAFMSDIPEAEETLEEGEEVFLD